MLRAIRHGLVWASLSVVGAISLYCLYTWHGLNVENATIQQLLSGQDVAVEQVVAKPQIRLARACYLKQKKRYDEALATLSAIMAVGDSALQAKVRYNLGNIYLEQAVVSVENNDTSRAMPLVMLAKQAYRQALALDSQFWDAKYNLEVAMRLLPEMERLDLENEDPKQQKAELWTTVPGFPRGLP
ncbi:MxaK protein [Crenothrix polyspora]|uniref:MxaK protein n=1 Tax=Crenothrix polyspora TaxID=360316 RepID=A0A1R4H371_9GAMM|nr:MxaK protein [Crenothrix polyspora]SJM90299.1 conserved hypothetical protein [Crenothrix polyspora]